MPEIGNEVGRVKPDFKSAFIGLLKKLAPNKAVQPSKLDHPTIAREELYKIIHEESVSSDQFLGQQISIGQAPSKFTFPNSEIKYGLQALPKWTKAAGDKETAGILFTDLSGATRFRDLAKGEQSDVDIFVLDYSNRTPERASALLSQLSLTERAFILVPDGFTGTVKGDHIVERGKKLLGSVHVHPSGNPPSGHDFANMVYSGESVKGVVGDDRLYLFVRTKETPELEIQATRDGRSTTMHDYGVELGDAMTEIERSGIPTSGARMQVLINHCREKSILLYAGDMTENEFTRVV